MKLSNKFLVAAACAWTSSCLLDYDWMPKACKTRRTKQRSHKPCYIDILAKSYPYSKADHIPCENSSGNLGKNDWPLMVKIKFCDPCQARLFSCHVLSCPRARVQPAVRTCESMVSQIIFLDRICRRVFFINRSGRSGHWGEGLKANRELGQVWKITLPLEPKWQ